MASGWHAWAAASARAGPRGGGGTSRAASYAKELAGVASSVPRRSSRSCGGKSGTRAMMAAAPAAAASKIRARFSRLDMESGSCSPAAHPADVAPGARMQAVARTAQIQALRIALHRIAVDAVGGRAVARDAHRVGQGRIGRAAVGDQDLAGRVRPAILQRDGKLRAQGLARQLGPPGGQAPRAGVRLRGQPEPRQAGQPRGRIAVQVAHEGRDRRGHGHEFARAALALQRRPLALDGGDAVFLVPDGAAALCRQGRASRAARRRRRRAPGLLRVSPRTDRARDRARHAPAAPIRRRPRAPAPAARCPARSATWLSTGAGRARAARAGSAERPHSPRGGTWRSRSRFPRPSRARRPAATPVPCARDAARPRVAAGGQQQQRNQAGGKRQASMARGGTDGSGQRIGRNARAPRGPHDSVQTPRAAGAGSRAARVPACGMQTCAADMGIRAATVRGGRRAKTARQNGPGMTGPGACIRHETQCCLCLPAARFKPESLPDRGKSKRRCAAFFGMTAK